MIFIAFGDVELQPWAKEKNVKDETTVAHDELLMNK